MIPPYDANKVYVMVKGNCECSGQIEKECQIPINELITHETTKNREKEEVVGSYRSRAMRRLCHFNVMC